MTLEYEIIENNDTKLVAQTVQQFLDNGWTLHGELVVGENGYAQAVKREKSLQADWEPGYEAAIERGNQYKKEIVNGAGMIALDDATDQYRFPEEEMLVLKSGKVKVCPAWQFSPQVQPYMKSLNEIFKDCWWIYLFLTQVEPAFNGKTPLQTLSEGSSKKVLEFAKETVRGL